ncbi:MAG TPA: hypothetical protein VKB59_02945, partial [Micromonosporaceae bacterium]|nr:hypothetical protein [Micromonosporaceae bacterium]
MSAQRIRRSSPWAISLVAVGCLIIALGGCAKGRTAAAGNATGVAADIPVFSVSVSKFTYSGMPDSVPADKPFRIVFSNNESFPITHEMVVVQIPAGKTLDDLVADAKAKGADSEDDWLHFGEIG